MGYKAANNASSTLAANITSGALSLSIQTGDQAKFPVINNGGVGTDYTYITLVDAAKNTEIVKVTRRDTGATVMTIVRAQDGTTARAWLSGDAVALMLPAAVVNDAFVAPVADAAAASASASAAATSASNAATSASNAATSASNAATSASNAISLAGLKSIDYTLAANALTLKLNPTTLSFRSATLTDGAPVNVSNVAQLTTTISSGSTGGTVSAVQSDIVLLAINNAGAMELAWTNLAGGAKLDETNLITTVAEGGAGAADSATTIYSTTAQTNVAYKVVGIFRSTQTVAGTWAQAPALVQGIGGQALAALSSFGYGQTWQSLLGSRVLGTTYYNTTGKPIVVHVVASSTSASFFRMSVNSINIEGAIISGYSCDLTSIVPVGGNYVVTVLTGTPTISSWVELR